MNALENITNSGGKDIIVSLSKNKSWLEYLSYFMELKSKNETFDIFVDTVPNTMVGNKCFIVFDGYIRGCMEIVKIKETVDNEICIKLFPTITTIPQKFFMDDIGGDGYKYFYDNSKTQ